MEFAMVILGLVFLAAPDLTSLAHSLLTSEEDSTLPHSTLRNNLRVELTMRQNLIVMGASAGQNFTRNSFVAFT
jgi:hypothetical protein